MFKPLKDYVEMAILIVFAVSVWYAVIYLLFKLISTGTYKEALCQKENQ